jgi:hypothetical protein
MCDLPRFDLKLEPRVTSNGGLCFSMFSKLSYFSMWNFGEIKLISIYRGAKSPKHIYTMVQYKYDGRVLQVRKCTRPCRILLEKSTLYYSCISVYTATCSIRLHSGLLNLPWNLVLDYLVLGTMVYSCVHTLECMSTMMVSWQTVY